ncbi:hypothetical protein GCM10009717_21620 [Agromyces allii]|uniref:Tyr recombinase domain-containing protein n=2 Tax=Agromyces allii TaxID=393607 RepID=A0ABP5BZI6_9MICO
MPGGEKALTFNQTLRHAGVKYYRVRDETRLMIENYRPRGIADPAWSHVREFVVASIVPYATSSDSVVLADLGYVTRYALWLVEDGAPLSVRTAFCAPVIDRYVRVVIAKRSQRYRHEVAARLTLLANLHTGAQLTATVPSKTLAPKPYSPAELADLVSAARARSMVRARNDIIATIVLGAGAGLIAREMPHVRVRDLQPAPWGYSVHVRSDVPRIIPLHRIWISHIAPFLEDRDRDDYLAWPHRARDEKSTRMKGGLLAGYSGVLPHPGRLRTNWILHLIHQGFIPTQIMRLARLETAGALNSYYSLLPAAESPDPWEIAGGDSAHD